MRMKSNGRIAIAAVPMSISSTAEVEICLKQQGTKRRGKDIDQTLQRLVCAGNWSRCFSGTINEVDDAMAGW